MNRRIRPDRALLDELDAIENEAGDLAFPEAMRLRLAIVVSEAHDREIALLAEVAVKKSAAIVARRTP